MYVRRTYVYVYVNYCHALVSSSDIQGTSATKGDDGLYEGLSWVHQQVTSKQVKKAVTKPVQETGDSVAKKSGLFSSWFSALGSYFASTSTPVSEYPVL